MSKLTRKPPRVYESNCYAEARKEYDRRCAIWRAAPDPNRSPYFCERPSHKAAVPHFLVGWGDPEIGAVRVESFVPVDARRRDSLLDAPVTFAGHWKVGDTDHAPLDEPPPKPIAAQHLAIRLWRVLKG